jgi:hypothetical protein
VASDPFRLAFAVRLQSALLVVPTFIGVLAGAALALGPGVETRLRERET